MEHTIVLDLNGIELNVAYLGDEKHGNLSITRVECNGKDYMSNYDEYERRKLFELLRCQLK